MGGAVIVLTGIGGAVAWRGRKQDAGTKGHERKAVDLGLDVRPGRTVRGAVSAGRTLSAALAEHGVSPGEARRIEAAATGMALEAGPSPSVRDLVLYYRQDKGRGEQLAGVAMRLSLDTHIYVVRGADAVWRAHVAESQPIQTEVRADAIVSGPGAFAADAVRAGVPDNLIDAFAAVFAYDLDFARDVGAGDEFEMVYRRRADLTGQTVAVDEVLFMAFRDGAKPRLAYYRFRDDLGQADWYDRTGASARKTFMKTPVNGARVTSPFMLSRFHPTLGIVRPHQGVDFGCPVGTPIMAARDGRVLAKGFEAKGYGNFVFLDHGGGESTRYGHMSAFADPLTVGMAVSQGQVIGYVGQTGAATGPHLHFEVRQDDRPLDPLTVTGDVYSRLSGAAFARFEREADEIDRWRREAPSAAQ